MQSRSSEAEVLHSVAACEVILVPMYLSSFARGKAACVVQCQHQSNQAQMKASIDSYIVSIPSVVCPNSLVNLVPQLRKKLDSFSCLSKY